MEHHHHLLLNLNPVASHPGTYLSHTEGGVDSAILTCTSLVLARFGIRPLILDERADQTPVGRADGLQPKTIETLRMLGLADTLLQQSVKIYDITMWQSMSSSHEPELRRVGREIHYPAFIVDLVDPFVLIGHQGMVEKAFASDLAKRGISVRRCHKLDSVSVKDDGTMEVSSAFNVTRDLRSFDTTYLVGCDGAHSRVRKLIVGPSDPGARDDPDEMSVWGVLDGDVETNFPDIWTKCVVFSEQYGSVLIIPRERDMTRLYIEMRPDSDISANSNPARVQAAIMRRAAQILLPYRIRWKSVEWFGQYRVSQRVAPKFSSAVPMPPGSGRQQTPTPATINEAIDIDTDGEQRIFIAGDAAHTHSPKAAQGMNTALHDSWNLAWKLNLAIRGLAKPSVLLDSYSWERQKIARDLVAFDFTHAQEMSRGNPAALADNFRKNVRFISGVGCEYAPNALNREPEGFDDEKGSEEGSTGAGAGHQKLGARPGCTLPPGKVSRYIDANPVDVQLDIPVLGQFRLYFFIPDILSAPAAAFLVSLCGAIAEPESLIHRLSAAAGKSYLERPRVPSHEDIFKRPERYIAVSQLFAFALISKSPLATAPYTYPLSLSPKKTNQILHRTVPHNPSSKLIRRRSINIKAPLRDLRPARDPLALALDHLPGRHAGPGHAGADVHGEVPGRAAAGRRGRHRQRAARRLRRRRPKVGHDPRRRRRRRRRDGPRGRAVAGRVL